MKIKYSKKLKRKNLIPGIVLVILGIFSVWMESSNPVRYFPVLGGLLFLGNYFFLKRTPYLQVGSDVLVSRNSFRKKVIKLSEVIRIKKFAGDVTLFTPESKLKIHSEAIDKASMREFDGLIASLDTKVEEHPCQKISFNNS